MGTVLAFKAPGQPPVTVPTADSGQPPLAMVGGLSRAILGLGLATETLCHSVCDGLGRFGAAFDEALRINEAHSRLQADIAAAMNMVAIDPETAADRLRTLREDYARLTPSPGPAPLRA